MFANAKDCDRWSRHPGVNPTTNRKIRIDGPTYKKIAIACAGLGTRGGARTPPTRSVDCAAFLADPSVNPSTGRKIKRDGPTSIRLMRECGATGAGAKTRETRDEIAVRVKRAISSIDAAQWDMCMSGERKSKFRAKLTNVTVLGKGSFGEIYLAKIDGVVFAVKEAYLSASERVSMLKNVGRRTRPGEIQKNSYPEEYRLLQFVQTLLPTTPNFTYVYDVAACEGCELTKAGNGYCYLTFMEPAAGDLSRLIAANDDRLSTNAIRSILYQLLIAVEEIHSRYGIFHRDIKLENVLYKLVPQGGTVAYNVGTRTYHVENVGVLALLSDFGVADILLPKYSGQKIYYGVRNAMVTDGGTFEPIRCEFTAAGRDRKKRTTPIYWKDDSGSTVATGTYNAFMGDLQLYPSVAVDLNDADKFPPFEFFYDIQDVLKMFVGGNRTVQPGAHRGIPNFNTDLKRLLTEYRKEKFPFHLDSVKYVLAREMLKTLYVPSRAEDTDAFRLA